MSLEIDVFADYVCPYCLLAEKVITGAIKEHDAHIRWRPFALRPDPVPTLRVEDGYLPRVWRQSVYPLAEHLGVEIVLPRISPQPRSDKAFEVFLMTEERGRGHEYSMGVFRAFFVEERDIGDPAVVAGIAAEAGLEPEGTREALESGRYHPALAEAQRYAVEEVGVSAVPTILIGGHRIEGMPEPEAFRRLVTQLATGQETSPVVAARRNPAG